MNDMTPASIGHNSGDLSAFIAEHVQAQREATTEFKQRADALAQGAARAEIKDQDTAGKATDLIKMINTLLKKVEDARKAAKEPLLEGGRQVDAVFNAIKTAAEDAKRTAEGKLNSYVREQRRKEEEERRRLAEEARKTMEAAQQAQAPQAAQELAEKAATLATQAAAAPASVPVRSDLGAAATTRKVTKHEITDQALLPPEYWIPDLALIAAHVKAGKTIPGVRVWVEEQVVVR